jgi:hypothetical protein
MSINIKNIPIKKMKAGFDWFLIKSEKSKNSIGEKIREMNTYIYAEGLIVKQH